MVGSLYVVDSADDIAEENLCAEISGSGYYTCSQVLYGTKIVFNAADPTGYFSVANILAYRSENLAANSTVITQPE